MEGTVKSFLDSKGYGFIRGDDGNDYFVHRGDVPGDVRLIEGLRVGFEEAATPKGYKARKVKTLSPAQDVLRYQVPEDVEVFKRDVSHGWQVIEECSWKITGSSRHGPDAAMADLRHNAQRLGANAVRFSTYFKTTGSEPGTGRGTHHFTIHNYVGMPVNIGKASTRGVDAADFNGMEQRADRLKTELVAKTQASRSAAITGIVVSYAVAIFGSLLLKGSASAIHPGLGFGGLFAFFPALVIATVISCFIWALTYKDHDSWLQRST